MKNWEQIRQEYETTPISVAALAAKYEIAPSTLRGRIKRENWQRTKAAKKPAKKKTPRKAAKKPRQPKAEPLNEKQRLFCLYYLKYFNATKAYQKAYKCAYTTAGTEGYRSLKKPEIAAEIERMKEERAAELKIDARDVLQKIIDIAYADITDFISFGDRKVTKESIAGYGPDDEPIRIPEQIDEYEFRLKNDDEIDGSLVTDLRETANGISIKLADKMRAIEMLAKYTRLLTDEELLQLQQEKLKAETAKLRLEADQEDAEAGSVVIVRNRDEMERRMREREAAAHGGE